MKAFASLHSCINHPLGIEASDVRSLLEQFEESEANLVGSQPQNSAAGRNVPEKPKLVQSLVFTCQHDNV